PGRLLRLTIRWRPCFRPASPPHAPPPAAQPSGISTPRHVGPAAYRPLAPAPSPLALVPPSFQPQPGIGGGIIGLFRKSCHCCSTSWIRNSDITGTGTDL